MATRKRASTRTKLLRRAVKAGRSALREAERRVPPDLRRQLERTINDGQKAVHAALKDVQAQVNRTARQADLDKALKRLDGLSKQVQQLARSVSARATAQPAARKPATRKAAVRKPARRRATPRKAATPKAAPRRAAAARRPSTRGAASPRPVPPSPPPGPVPERVESEESGGSAS